MKPQYDANVLTYLQWRGDLSMVQSPFCHIDSLIFCCLSYLNWDGIAEGRTARESISLADAAAAWKNLPPNQQVVRVPTDQELLTVAAESRRFGEIRLFRYTERFSEERQEQFSAVTFLLDEETVYVAFRGTDATLTGWREDFNMSFLQTIPSQETATAYLRSVLEMDFPNVYVGGHSKGGNLAVYAAVHAQPAFLPRIRAVYNNDGPGFVSDVFQQPQYALLQTRVHTFVPQASLVGMLLEHDEEYRVVYSTQKGFLQHDPYSWCVVRNDWYYLQEITAASKLMDTSLKKWILGMKPEEREKLTDGIFHVLQSETNAHTVQDLVDGGKNTITAVLRAWGDTPPETRRFMQKMLLELLLTVRDLVAAQRRGQSPEEIYAAIEQHQHEQKKQ